MATEAHTLFSEYLLIFCKQVRITGEIVLIHIAHKTVIVYNREKWLPGHATHYYPWLIRCELRGEMECEKKLYSVAVWWL